MTARATRYTRLVVTVPRPIAEPFAAALVELGAGAVEEREATEPSELTEPREIELVLTLPAEASTDEWASLVQALYRAFSEQLELPLQELRVQVESCEFDYHAQWLADLVPQQLTDKIQFVPTHHRDRDASSERILYFEPHPSFGDGSHPTTRLASRAVERVCEERPNCCVLDIGTGNGVLSFVAVVSGAQSSYGIDLDPEAVNSARHNADLNRLDRVCSFDEAQLGTVTARYDLVVANLEPRTQVELLRAMAARVRPRGTLVVTGFLVEQAAAITEPLAALGFVLSHVDSAQDYALEVWRAGDEGGWGKDHGRGGVR